MLLYRNCEKIIITETGMRAIYISHDLNPTSGTVKVNVNLLIDIPLKCHELLNGCFKMDLFNTSFLLTPSLCYFIFQYV